MANIKIITFHSVDNYGAVLQCVALNQYLKSLGHNVSTIDYRPQYLASASYYKPVFYTTQYVYQHSKKNNVLKAISAGLRTIWHNVNRATNQAYLKKHKAFRTFLEDNVSLTKKYKTYEKLKNNPPEADWYIVGSDQLWSYKILNGLDPAYFLRFGKAKKAAYAISAGTEFNNPQFLTEISKLTEDFSVIGCRETLLTESIKKSVKCECRDVLDPVFLLNATEWERYCKTNSSAEEYVLVYKLGRHDVEFEETLDYVRGKYKIVDISPIQTMKSDCYDNTCGPSEFLGYIRNAKIVITDSFHATAFSLIFQRKFVSIIHSEKQDRVSDLLKRFDLEDVLVNDMREIEDAVKANIDYVKINEAIDISVTTSKKLLEQII